METREGSIDTRHGLYSYVAYARGTTTTIVSRYDERSVHDSEKSRPYPYRNTTHAYRTDDRADIHSETAYIREDLPPRMSRRNRGFCSWSSRRATDVTTRGTYRREKEKRLFYLILSYTYTTRHTRERNRDSRGQKPQPPTQSVAVWPAMAS